MENVNKKIFVIGAQIPSNPNGGAKVIYDRLLILSKYFDIFLLVRDRNPRSIKNLEFLKWIRVIKKTKPYNFFIFLFRYFMLSIFYIYKTVIKEKIKVIQLESFDDLIYSIILLPLKLCNINFYYTAHDIQCLYYNKKTTKFKLTKLMEKMYFKFFIDYIFVWGVDDYNEIMSWKCIPEKKIKIIHPLVILNEEKSWQLNKDTNFVFMGSVNHKPNKDSVEFILKNLWPEIKKISPQSKLYLILGSNTNNFNIEDENIIDCGFVEDPRDIMKKCNIFLAPIVSGTGIKIKIIESFNFGIPLISTPMGFRNFDYIDDTIALIAKDKNDFLRKIEKLINNKSLLLNVSDYEKEYFKTNFSKNNAELYKKYYSI